VSLRVYTVTDHDGVWLGGTSIVFAPDEEEAIKFLDKELIENGLQPFALHPYHLEEVDTSQPRAIVLDNGDY
jgi:hypothetical protein